MDFDADGDRDLLSGSYSPGEIYLFRRGADGAFAAGETLKFESGEPLVVGSAAHVCAADWDADGDLDLVIGEIGGRVALVTNQGSNAKPVYPGHEWLQAEGTEVHVAGGDAGPTVADWDGDGLADLLVGTGEGTVEFYRNVGTAQKPLLAAGTTLVRSPSLAPRTEAEAWASPQGRQLKPAEEPSGCGMRCKPCVVDYNGDGRLDLLVGDFAMQQRPKPELSAEQERRAEELRKQRGELLAQIQGEGPPDEDEDEGESSDAKAHRTEAIQKYAEVARELQQYEAGNDFHGWVWLYLRAASDRDR